MRYLTNNSTDRTLSTHYIIPNQLSLTLSNNDMTFLGPLNMMNSNNSNNESMLQHMNNDIIMSNSERLTIAKKLKKNVSNSFNLIRRRNRSSSECTSKQGGVSSICTSSMNSTMIISETDSFCSISIHDTDYVRKEIAKIVVSIPKRSCLAGTRASECSAAANDKKKTLTVRFKRASELNNVVKVKSFSDDSNLWWSSIELQQSRTEIIHSAQELSSHQQQSQKDILKLFLSSYKSMREELIQFEENYYSKTENDVLLTPLDSAPQLSSHSRYNDYVKGHQYGYNALEKYIGYDLGTRRKRVTETIKAVCEFYQNKRSVMYTSNEDYEVTTQQYCKSLTMVDRYWAKFSGKVAAAACGINTTTTTKANTVTRTK